MSGGPASSAPAGPDRVGQRPGAFLDHVAAGLDPAVDVHVILDNLSAHKSARVHAGLKAHPNGTVPCTPAAAAWMNAMEGFVSPRARQRLKTAVFNSLDECIVAVDGSIDHAAKPFRWSRDPGDLVASWTRGHRRVQEMEASL